MKNFLILFLIIFIPLFIFNQEEPIPEKNHYYLQEWINEDGLKEACLLEGDSIPPESLPEGFVEVSLEEIKQKGYLTGKEQLELARKRNGSIDSVVSGQDAGRQAYSWADAWNEGGVDKYVARSLTSSTYDEKIRTVSRLRKWENNIIRHEHWGYQTQSHAGPRGRPAAVSWQGQWSASRTITLDVHGWHTWRYREPNPITAETQAYDTQ